MMTANDAIRRWAAEVGGIRKAAALIGISPGHMCHLARGSRGLTPEMALRLESASKGRLKKEALVWGAAA
jgi:DNA-binding transcriptional regulator YdaS (Cro superfamily)